MTGSQKLTWGLILGLVGGLLFAVGVIFSSTLIGACIGIPMIMLGLPIMIWGSVWTYQGQFQKQGEAIAHGVQHGIQRARETEERSSPETR